MNYRQKQQALSRLGIVHVIFGGLNILFQIAGLLLVRERYMHVTVLRNYHVFLAGAGIWAGLASFITGVCGIIGKRKLERRSAHKSPQYVGRASMPRTVEAFSALTIISAVLTLAQLVVHAYTLWLLVRILALQLGFYELTYRLYVVLLTALYSLMLLSGVINLIAHIVGSVAGCSLISRIKRSKDTDAEVMRRTAPLLVYQNSYSYTPPNVNGAALRTYEQQPSLNEGRSTVGSTMRSQLSSSSSMRSVRSPRSP